MGSLLMISDLDYNISLKLIVMLFASLNASFDQENRTSKILDSVDYTSTSEVVY